MNAEKEFPSRKRLRWQNFDYSTPGAYFITVCTHNRKCTLSHIVKRIPHLPSQPETFEIKLTQYGEIVDKVISSISIHSKATIDRYVIMPNHIHLIIIITDNEELRAIRESPLRGRSVISKIIGYIKMNASKQIHHIHEKSDVWQRGFHDHIIRDRRDFEEISKYIYENPLKWRHDKLYAED